MSPMNRYQFDKVQRCGKKKTRMRVFFLNGSLSYIKTDVDVRFRDLLRWLFKR